MTQDRETRFDKTRVMVRPAEDADLSVLSELFDMGVLEGQVPDNDTGADIENFREAYGSDDAMSGFWVAVYEGAVVGMVGVQRHDKNVAEIRRLRVRPDRRRRGIGSMLMERAIAFCRERDYLKVILDTRVEEEPAIRIFRKFGFQLGRTREIDGRRLIDFYLDIYREPEIRE